MEMTKALEYKDIVLIPDHFNKLSSRKDANTNVRFGKHEFRLPVIPSNMKTVIDCNIAKKLDNNGYMYVMHRFDNFESAKKIIKDTSIKIKSVSVGVNQDSYDFLTEYGLQIDYLTIDIAHGYCEKMSKMIRFVKKYFPKIFLIAGNIGTVAGYNFLRELGADAIKVGIGSGIICSTYNNTGFGTPMVTTLKQIHRYKHYNSRIKHVPIIADGGCREYGDIAKALTLGADMVMSGYFFSGCVDSPAIDIGGKKQYYGSTSYTQKQDWFDFIEGRDVIVNTDQPYLNKMILIENALKSSITYAGGKDISAFKDVDYYIK